MPTFTLADADQRVHTYECTLHPATEGQQILWALVGLASGPLANLLKAAVPLLDLFKGRNVAAVLEDPAALDSLKASLGGLDFGSIGQSLRLALASASMPDLVASILSKTTRDGKALSGRIAFDEAYTGNYRELGAAVWEVVKANRFLSLLGM